MWGFISLGLTHCDGVSFSRDSLVTRWEAPDGFGAFPVRRWPTIILRYFDAVGWVF